MSCPDCTTGGFLLGEPAGTISTMGAYFSPNPENDQPSNKAILLLTDAFGLPMKNCKIMADNLAKRLACDVWVPDIFNGESFTQVGPQLSNDVSLRKSAIWRGPVGYAQSCLGENVMDGLSQILSRGSEAHPSFDQQQTIRRGRAHCKGMASPIIPCANRMD